MFGKNKKLSIAFYWHMHQPYYKLNTQGDYLMPWVRLHAIKDYLDMLLIMKKYPKLKLNFNFSPVLIDAILDYAENGAEDVHSKLTKTRVEELTDDDKRFILNNFFDANYSSMVAHHPAYDALFQKRMQMDYPEVESFSDSEYGDIMAWFNLAWFDSMYAEMFPELLKLAEKGNDFSLEDRIEILNYSTKILKMIVPTYKEFLKEGRIEITTSPYYHPILPILTDIKCASRNIPNPDALPQNLKMGKDAMIQTKWALDRMEEVFGVRPKGIWPPEHCLSAKTLDMLKDLGVDWTITDEGILANSINFEFVRDFKGYLEDPYYLLKTYEYKTKNNSNIDLIFRDSSIPNLINFEYPHVEAEKAANDLYDRMKVIQSKILTSPDENHLLTIACDGENCWENYQSDGKEFLDAIYSMIEEDDSLETVLISDYIKKDKNKKDLPKIYSGSWINRNFQLWIGEPTKDLAWTYLKHVHDDFTKFEHENPDNPNLEKARRELFISESSDWFWWYGEPNNSEQDHIFDYLFREHLKNVYRILGLEVPVSLQTSLMGTDTYDSTIPVMDSQNKIDDEWLNAGFIDILAKNDNDVHLFEKVIFGFDEEYLYLRFILNHEIRENNSQMTQQIYLYMRNCDIDQNLSPVRPLVKGDKIPTLFKEKFHNEIRLTFSSGLLRPLQFIEALPENLWKEKDAENIKISYDNVIDISIPFDTIEIKHGEMLEFFFVTADYDVMETCNPPCILLTMLRPSK